MAVRADGRCLAAHALEKAMVLSWIPPQDRYTHSLTHTLLLRTSAAERAVSGTAEASLWLGTVSTYSPFVGLPWWLSG